MSWIDRNGKIRTAANVVGCIHGCIGTLREMRADIRHHVPARRKSKHANLVRIDVPLRCVKAHEPNCPLCVFKRCGCFRMNIALTIVMVSRARIRHSIFQQHARDPSRREPIADFRAFKIDCQNGIASARENRDCSARILPLRRIDRHCRPRNLFHCNPRPARDEILGLRYRFRILWPCDRLRIRNRTRPYRYLRVPLRGLPNGLLRFQAAKCEGDTENEEQRHKDTARAVIGVHQTSVAQRSIEQTSLIRESAGNQRCQPPVRS